MKLIDKCKIFYKIAAEQTPEESKRDYDMFISLLPGKTIRNILEGIYMFKDEPFFKLDDFIPMLEEEPFEYLISAARKVGLDTPIIKKIITQIVENDLKSMKYVSVDEYLKIEGARAVLPEDILKKSQQRVILFLIKLYRSDLPTAQEELVKSWRELWKESTRFPHTFLEELAKKFGVDFHTKALMGMEYSAHLDERLQNILHIKEGLTAYDIGMIFWNWDHLTGEKLLDIINRSTPEAKEYMKGFLYYDHTRYQGKNPEYFILDESMQFMGEDYQYHYWPSDIGWDRLSDLTMFPDLKHKWANIFSEFKIIPA